MRTSDILTKARSLVSAGWWKAGGHSEGPNATCALVAISTCCGDVTTMKMIDVCNVFKSVIGTDDIPAWNDAKERTKAEVLQAFGMAIAIAKATEDFTHRENKKKTVEFPSFIPQAFGMKEATA